MAKVRINKKSLKENDLEIALYDISGYVKTHPKQIFIPLAGIVLAIVIGWYTIKYFNDQNQSLELAFLQAQVQLRTATTTKDKSSEILGITRALDSFKKLASENKYTKTGKISAVYAGDCLFYQKKYDDAIKAYRDAIAGGPPKITAAWAQMSIGYAYLNKGDFKSAVTEFNKVVIAYPDSFLVPSARLQMGICYEKQNDLAKAKETYEMVIKTYSDSVWKSEAEARLSAMGAIIPANPKAG